MRSLDSSSARQNRQNVPYVHQKIEQELAITLIFNENSENFSLFCFRT